MSPEIRISDVDREAAVTALGEHYASGRLSKDEYDERATSAYAAKTAASLRPLFADLPAPHPPVLGRPAGRRPDRATYQTPQPQVGPRRRSWHAGLPMLPVLFVVAGIALVAGAPWLLAILVGVLWFSRAGGCGRRYRSGNDRASRGSWA
jgi:hypothetical protein